VALTPTAVERIAQAIHALRPQWPIASLETFLRDPKLANRPTRDVAIALTWIAVDPDTRTPGAWWRAATVDEAQTYRNPGTVCTIHPSQLEPCRHCTAQRVPANLERGTRNLPLALARAELAQTRANTCAHGILKGHGTCHDCQNSPAPTTSTPNTAKPAKSTRSSADSPDTAPTDQPTPPAKTPTPPSPAQTATPAPTPNTAQTAPDSPPVESR
jgi:hypothetical protein